MQELLYYAETKPCLHRNCAYRLSVTAGLSALSCHLIQQHPVIAGKINRLINDLAQITISISADSDKKITIFYFKIVTALANNTAYQPSIFQADRLAANSGNI